MTGLDVPSVETQYMLKGSNAQRKNTSAKLAISLATLPACVF